MFRRRFRIIVILGAAVAAVVVTAVTPPLTGRMMAFRGNWLLSKPTAQQSGGSVRKVVATYFEFALAAKIAQRVEARHLTNDVDRIEYALRRVQMRVLSYGELQFNQHDWPALLSGIGYCDQINAAACKVLAHSFTHAQLYALYDSEHRTSPHTIGRVWSTERNEWLYFDAAADRPVVFRRRADGGVELLNHASAIYAGRETPATWTYRLDGWVLNEYTSTYPAYLTNHVLNSLRRPVDFRPVTMPSESPVESPVSLPLPASPRDSPRYAGIARQYVAARAEDILGDQSEARARYSALAALSDNGLDDESRLLVAAARQFAARRDPAAPGL